MNLLSIGGSDPSSGAGIQSDVKTFDMLNSYGLTVITAITGQNTSNFGMIQPVSKKILKNQLELLISDFKIDGIKIGMVYNSEIIKTIHSELKNKKIPIVLDPVIKSTTGGLLIEKTAIKDFKKFLIPLATIITPNKFEAEFLSQIKINSKKSLLKAAQKIQKMGGSVKAIEKGFFQSEIRQNAYRLKKEADDGERILVGVNKYAEKEVQPDLLRIDDRIEIQQKKDLKNLRSTRDSKKVEKALSDMKNAADTDENLMPYIISAAKAYATTGEISNTFREVFGEYRPKEVF